jgi:hypothetical protein
VADGVDPLALPRQGVSLVLEPEDRATGREVGPVDEFGEVIDRQLRVVDERADRATYLAQVVRWDVRGHAHRNAR